MGLTAAIVELTLDTAYIHLSLGGLLFTLNAIGYAALAAALAPPRFPIGSCAGSLAPTRRPGRVHRGHDRRVPRHRPVLHLGWIAKAVEVGILALLAVDLVRVYGSPAGLVRAAMRPFGRMRSRGPRPD